MSKRKAYVPRYANPVGGLVLFARMSAKAEDSAPLRQDQLGDLGLAYRMSLQALLTGEATEEAWSCVVCSVNVAMALSEIGIADNCTDEFAAALEGLFRAKVRSVKSGSFRLDGDAIQDVKLALSLHDQQMLVAERRQVVAALRTVRDRVEAGNVYTVEAA